MLANHFQNGIESAKLVWSRIPNSEEPLYHDDAAGLLKKSDGSGVESLDYEVVENYAYREEQVFPCCQICLDLLALFVCFCLTEQFVGCAFEICRRNEESCM